NHFQLLTLVINSLKKTIPASRETEILQDTVEKAIELTRTFSDCNQLPSWVAEIQPVEALRAAIVSHRTTILARNLVVKESLDDISDVAIMADPFLLEIAFGHVIENVTETAPAGCMIEINGQVEMRDTSLPVVVLGFCRSVRSSGASDAMKL